MRRGLDQSGWDLLVSARDQYQSTPVIRSRREEIVIQYTASEIVGRALSLDPASLLSPPYRDMAMVRADLAAAGFTDFSFEKLPERSRTGSSREAAIATCQGGVLRKPYRVSRSGSSRRDHRSRGRRFG
jgi:hypothetical protein